MGRRIHGPPNGLFASLARQCIRKPTQGAKKPSTAADSTGFSNRVWHGATQLFGLVKQTEDLVFIGVRHFPLKIANRDEGASQPNLVGTLATYGRFVLEHSQR
jgi:hypothetical protein